MSHTKLVYRRRRDGDSIPLQCGPHFIVWSRMIRQFVAVGQDDFGTEESPIAILQNSGP